MYACYDWVTIPKGPEHINMYTASLRGSLVYVYLKLHSMLISGLPFVRDAQDDLQCTNIPFASSAQKVQREVYEPVHACEQSSNGASTRS